jgi:hypothetical protein
LELEQKHLDMMESIKDGATIFGYKEAKLLREVQRIDRELIQVIDDISELEAIEGKEYDGAGRVPYFGAILTKKGKKLVRNHLLKRATNI